MFKKTLVTGAILLSTNAIAASAPDCSPDKDGRILNGIVVSIADTKYSFYLDRLLGKNKNYEITLLSSKEIGPQEKEKLMMRKAKRDHFNSKDIVDSGMEVQYMKNKIYRQYYEISTPDYPNLIAEYYSIPHYCGVDLGSIYIISDKIEGFTPDFADRPDSPY